jgi:hypothetical protein
VAWRAAARQGEVYSAELLRWETGPSPAADARGEEEASGTRAGGETGDLRRVRWAGAGPNVSISIRAPVQWRRPAGALRTPVRSRERLRTALRSERFQLGIGEARPSCSGAPRSLLCVPATRMSQGMRREQLVLHLPKCGVCASLAAGEPVELSRRVPKARCYAFSGQRSG